MQSGDLQEADIQARLLADVATTRMRHKQDAVTEALQASKLRHHGIVARLSELCLMESIELCNPGLEAQTFKIEVRTPRMYLLLRWLWRAQSSIARPHKCACDRMGFDMQVDSPWLRPIGTLAEWLALPATLHSAARANNAFGSGDILAGGVLLLQAQECLRVPFALQVHTLAEQTVSATSSSAPIQAVETIDVRLVDRSTGSTVRPLLCLSCLRRPQLIVQLWCVVSHALQGTAHR